ncbi:MAG: hypothetical protein HDT32_02950 [Clostridiales bacterium]|nr:hypothetical protein [Clostridiales bacterium]
MFSDRYLKKSDDILQQDDIDQKLRIDLWNTIQKFYFDRVYSYMSDDTYSTSSLGSCVNNSLIIDLYENFMFKPIGNMRSWRLGYIKEQIEKFYKNLEWYRVYDLVEYIDNKLKDKSYSTEINFKLERNRSAYRLISNSICPIINKEEQDSIQSASNTKYDKVNNHINKAIEIFSNKEIQDYENVIKESIIAVESMCSIIVGNKSTLGDALKKLEKNGLIMHPSLKSAFDKLYGYTSDANGIRHAGDIGGKDSTFAEAKFMLVSCSAFINYLIDSNKG